MNLDFAESPLRNEHIFAHATLRCWRDPEWIRKVEAKQRRPRPQDRLVHRPGS